MSTCQGAPAPHDCPHGTACDWTPMQRGIHDPHCRLGDCSGCAPVRFDFTAAGRALEQRKAGRLPQPALSRRARREQERKHGKAKPAYALMPSACLDEPDAIQNAMQVAHDGVISTAGAARRSGVTWRQFKGEYAARTFEQLFGDNSQVAGLDQFRAFFAEHGERAVLVVATCEVVHP